MMKKILAIGLTVAAVTGCSSVTVMKDPGPANTGIRYYRPKPYLLVTPKDNTGRLVNLKVEYLPDFTEEYSIRPRGKTKVSLKDGWNLVGVNTDGPPPEPPAAEEAAPAPPPTDNLPPVVVAASNVPIGYYESVLEEVNGTKVFRGWRYIGFTVLGGGKTPADPSLPLCGSQACPYHATGHRHGLSCGGKDGANGANGEPCRMPEIQEPLFGLVFLNGVMTFRMLNEVAYNQGCPFYVESPTPAEPVAAAAPVQEPPVANVMSDSNESGVVGDADDTGGSGAAGDPEVPMPADGGQLTPPTVPDVNAEPLGMAPYDPGFDPAAGDAGNSVLELVPTQPPLEAGY